MEQIYQLKIELKHSNPLIWRRIQVREDITFSELHDSIQIAMGWEDGHLYEFSFKNIRIYDFQGDIDDGADPTERDSEDTFLSEIVSKVKSKFTYVYDFGDHWEHVIKLEKIQEEEEDKTYPICVDGARACPPEDCGGLWGYEDKLRILSDKNHPEYDDMLNWMGEDWNAELFDRDVTNFILQDYGRLREEFDEGADETPEMFLNPNMHDEYDELKKFTCPEDVRGDEGQHAQMTSWVEAELGEELSIEYQTFERLLNLGFDEAKSKTYILEALSIEWYYDLKYSTDHLDDRYSHNLQNLPEKPQELPRSKDAFDVLDLCAKGVPFAAIEHLQNDDSEETTSIVLKELKNHFDHQYCWVNCTFAPFWYALVAEGHICQALIDPVIELYEANSDDSDWLSIQGQYLIGKLAQQYPDLTTQKVLEAMEKDVDKKSMPYIFFLFDTFYFCDLDKYQARLLALLERDDLSWYDPLATTVAYLQIQEAIPILKRKLELLQKGPDENAWQNGSVVEIEEAIQILEGKITTGLDSLKPLCLTRKGSWKDELKEGEEFFYEDDDLIDPFDFEEPINQGSGKSMTWPKFPSVTPFIKEKTPERNDPCPCGSGKKYKKCCMD
ncbi:MAG: SEC-C metal-binding domain-containing protein [Reichenbachiella sp.]